MSYKLVYPTLSLHTCQWRWVRERGHEAAQTTGLALNALQGLELSLSKLSGLPATAVAHRSEELLHTPSYCYLNLFKGSFSVCFLNSHIEGPLSEMHKSFGC